MNMTVDKKSLGWSALGLLIGGITMGPVGALLGAGAGFSASKHLDAKKEAAKPFAPPGKPVPVPSTTAPSAITKPPGELVPSAKEAQVSGDFGCVRRISMQG